MRSYGAVILLLSFLFTLGGCDDRSCEDVICGPNENCNQGTCFCIDGFEGPDCQDYAYLKYEGNYFVNENCVPSTISGSYNSFISWDGFQANKLSISNFLNQGITAPAFIFTDFENKGNIIEVQFSQGLLQDVYGFGTFDGSFIPPRIQMEVQFTQAGVFHQCVITYFKQ